MANPTTVDVKVTINQSEIIAAVHEVVEAVQASCKFMRTVGTEKISREAVILEDRAILALHRMLSITVDGLPAAVVSMVDGLPTNEKDGSEMVTQEAPETESATSMIDPGMERLRRVRDSIKSKLDQAMVSKNAANAELGTAERAGATDSILAAQLARTQESAVIEALWAVVKSLDSELNRTPAVEEEKSS